MAAVDINGKPIEEEIDVIAVSWRRYLEREGGF